MHKRQPHRIAVRVPAALRFIAKRVGAIQNRQGSRGNQAKKEECSGTIQVIFHFISFPGRVHGGIPWHTLHVACDWSPARLGAHLNSGYQTVRAVFVCTVLVLYDFMVTSFFLYASHHIDMSASQGKMYYHTVLVVVQYQVFVGFYQV